MKYKSFYFLHVPKSDGRRFIDEVVLPLKYSNPTLKMITPIMGDYDGSGLDHYPHQGWHKDISDSTYIVTIVRDPIERAVSHYVHRMYDLMDIKYSDVDTRNINLTKEGFMSYMEQNPNLHNLYYKMFMNSYNSHEQIFNIQSNDIDINLFSKRIERINLMIDQKDFKEMYMNLLRKKIQSDIECDDIDFPLGFNHKAHMYKKYTNSESGKIYSSLTEDEKKSLKKYFRLSYYMYENATFWRP